jgi:hypothetical protein
MAVAFVLCDPGLHDDDPPTDFLALASR